MLQSRTLFPGLPAKYMHCPRITLAIVVLGLAALPGCMDGPFKLGRYSPWLNKEWQKEAEYGPLLPEKLAELEALRSGVNRLSPQEQQQRSQEMLTVMRNEKNALLVSNIVRTLAVYPTPESLEALRMASLNGESEIRIAACSGWASKGGPEAIEALATMLGSDTDADVRIAAAHALEKFRDPAAMKALGVALESNDPALQFRAVQSLKKVTDRDYGDSIPAWREYVQSGQAKPADSASFASKFFKWY